MREILRNLDRLLRGRFSERGSDAGTIPIAHLVQAALVLGITYGLFMGLYAALRTEAPTPMQIVVSAAKVPLLFLLTLLVTFPSLYVFSALGDSPLKGADTMRLLLAAVTVNLALLASFGPITGFFTLSTDSYPFMIVLNTVFFAVSGFVGLGFLGRMLGRLFDQAADTRSPDGGPEDGDDTHEDAAEGTAEGGLDDAARARIRRRIEADAARARAAERASASQRIFRIWIVIYAVVGAQMGWILRPFIGSPDLPFELFRTRQSNFFEGLWTAVKALFA